MIFLGFWLGALWALMTVGRHPAAYVPFIVAGALGWRASRRAEREEQTRAY